MSGLWQDLKYTVRLQLKRPLSSLVAVISLAVGIGANTALLSAIQTLFVDSLPVPEPSSLVLLNWEAADTSFIRWMSGSLSRTDGGLVRSNAFSFPVYREIEARQTSFSDFFAFAGVDRLNINVRGQAELGSAQLVSGTFFEGLGLIPRRGRLIQPADDIAGAPHVVVLSHAYWESRFGSSPGILGSQIRLNGVPFTVVGIAPAGFRGSLQVDSSPDLFIPLIDQTTVLPGRDRLGDKNQWWLQVMARLPSEGRLEQASGQLAGIWTQVLETLWSGELEAGFREDASIPRPHLASGSQGLQDLRSRLINPVAIAAAISTLILLMACANVAGLLLAQNTLRVSERAIRRSLGARRFHLVRQSFLEALSLSAAGALLGLPFLLAGDRLLNPLLGISNQPSFPISRLDLAALLTSLLLVLVASLAAGLFPALNVFRGSSDQIRSWAMRSIGRGGSHFRFARLLTVTQVCLSVFLVVLATQFVRSLQNLGATELGFEADGTLLFRLDPTLNGYQSGRLARFFNEAQEKLESLPGVVSVGFAQFSPLSGSASRRGIDSRQQEPASGRPPFAFTYFASRNFLETYRIPLLAGRGIGPEDQPGSPLIAVVSQSFAKEFFPGLSDPIGRTFQFSGDASPVTIVGLVPDIKTDTRRRTSASTVFVPYVQHPAEQAMTFAIRTREGHDIAAVASQAIAEIDPDVPLFDIQSFETQLNSSIDRERQLAYLSSVLGMLGLGLCAIGIYGLLTQQLNQRIPEFAIRIAFGARRRDIRRIVFGQLWVIPAGTFLGAGLALLCSKVTASFLYGLEERDPLSLGTAALLMFALAILVACRPAWRASRIAPWSVLR